MSSKRILTMLLLLSLMPCYYQVKAQQNVIIKETDVKTGKLVSPRHNAPDWKSEVKPFVMEISSDTWMYILVISVLLIISILIIKSREKWLRYDRKKISKRLYCSSCGGKLISGKNSAINVGLK